MNINKLYSGLIFKNYKVMCEELEIKFASGGNLRKSQFNNLARFCNFEKVGQKIIIIEVFENPLPKIDMRGKNPNSRNRVKPIYLNNPKLSSQWLEEENGMVIPKTLARTSTEEYWWKCNACLHKIFSSPAKRFNKCKGFTDEFITCQYCSLSKGAKIIYDFLQYNDIKFKLEYMYDNLLGLGGKKLRFDFALFNDENELITLIEYDGGYHDEELNPDIEKHKIVSSHDSLKDQYCNQNNIPLLRIHHTKMNEIKIILTKYLGKLSIPIVNDSDENILDIISNYEEKKKLLQMELSKLDDTINYFKSIVM